ncbi:MAG: hypothetical protein ACI9S8_002009 [Chlamydiales bacterium]|jgi:hypothetical protein
MSKTKIKKLEDQYPVLEGSWVANLPLENVVLDESSEMSAEEKEKRLLSLNNLQKCVEFDLTPFKDEISKNKTKWFSGETSLTICGILIPKLSLSGPVQTLKEAPRFLLETDRIPLEKSDMGSVDTSSKVSIFGLWDQQTNRPASDGICTDTFLLWQMDWAFQIDGQRLELSTEAYVMDPSFSQIEFSLRPNFSIGTAIQAAFQKLGFAELPSKWNLLDTVKIEDISVGVNHNEEENKTSITSFTIAAQITKDLSGFSDAPVLNKFKLRDIRSQAMVHSPFSKESSASLTLMGIFDFMNVDKTAALISLQGRLDLPTMDFQAEMQHREVAMPSTAKFVEFLKSCDLPVTVIPDFMNEISVARCEVYANASKGQFDISMGLANLVKVKIPLFDSFSIDYVEAQIRKVEDDMSVNLYGGISLGKINFSLSSLITKQSAALTARATNVSMKDLADTFSIPLPSEVNVDLVLQEVSLRISNNELSLTSTMDLTTTSSQDQEVKKLSMGDGKDWSIGRLQCSFSKGIASKKSKSAQIKIFTGSYVPESEPVEKEGTEGNGSPKRQEISLEIIPDIVCKGFELDFSYSDGGQQAEAQWNLIGKLDSLLFNNERVTLLAGYSRNKAEGAVAASHKVNLSLSRVQENIFTVEDFKGLRNTSGVVIENGGAEKIFNSLKQLQWLNAEGKGPVKLFEPWKGPVVYGLAGEYVIYTSQISNILLDKTKSLVSFAPDGDVLASLTAYTLMLSFDKTGGNTDWKLTAAGGLSLSAPGISDPIISVRKGTIELFGGKGAARKGLQFASAEAVTVLPSLAYPELTSDTYASLKGSISLNKLLFIRENQRWNFEAEASFTMGSIPEPLYTVLKPDQEVALPKEFKETPRAVSYSMTSMVKEDLQKKKQLIFEVSGGLKGVTIPDLFALSNEALKKELGQDLLPKLGESYFGVDKVGLSIGKECSIYCDFSVGLPAQINEFLGITEVEVNGKKGIKLLRSFTKDNLGTGEDAGLVKGSLSVGTAGISGSLKQSPFVTTNLHKLLGLSDKVPGIVETDGWFEIDFTEPEKQRKAEDLGKIFIEKPTLSFDFKKGSFSTTGGFKIDAERGVKLPLFFMKDLFRNLNLQDLAKLVPAAIPVRSIDFIDSKGELNVQGFKEYYNEMGIEDKTVANALWPVLELVKKEVSTELTKLPSRFRDYLSINIPDGLTYGLHITPEGSFSLVINTEGDPLQMILPQVPMLMGIRLRKLGLGTSFGGAALNMELDCELDMFNMLQMVGTQLIDPSIFPENMAPSHKDWNKMQTTWFVEDLYMLIVIATQIPIPIPLFYKRLEVVSKDISGFESNMAVSLPKPTLGLLGILKELIALKSFFTDKNALLPVPQSPLQLKGQEAPASTENNLTFNAGPFYLRLPKFFGVDKEGVYWEVTAEVEEMIRDLVMPKELSKEESTQSRFKRSVNHSLRSVRNRNYYSASYLTYDLTSHLSKGLKLWTKDTEIVKAIQANKEQILSKAQKSGALGKSIGLYDSRQLFNFKDLSHIMLNAGKKKSINYLIQYISIDDRVGDLPINFLNMLEANIGWLLTTPSEFTLEAYNKFAGREEVGSGGASRSQMLELIPKSKGQAVRDEEGVVLLLKGKGSIGGLVKVESAFGLSMSESLEAYVGYSFLGEVANLLKLSISGHAAVSPQEKDSYIPKFGVGGDISIVIPESHTLLEGKVKASNTGFAVDGSFSLFPDSWPISAKGKLNGMIKSNEFSLHGEATAQLGNLTLVNPSATISNNLVALSGTFLNQSLSLKILKENNLLTASADLSINILATKIQSKMKIDSQGMVSVAGLMEPINLPGVLKITGTNGQGGPQANFILRPGEIPDADLKVEVSLLGVKGTHDMEVRKNKLSYVMNGKLNNQVQCRLTLSGSNLSESGSLQAEGFISGFTELEQHIQRGFGQSVQAANNEIQKAEDRVNRAKATYDAEFQKVQQQLTQEANNRKSAATQAKNQAQSAVDAAVAVVNAVEQKIGNIKSSAEQVALDAAAKGKEAADAVAQQFQNIANGTQEKLNAHERWWNGLNGAQKFFGAAGYAAVKGTLTIARDAANAAVAAKRVLFDGMYQTFLKAQQNLSNFTNSLMGEKGLAQQALNQAKQVLEEANGVYNSLPDWVISPEKIIVEVGRRVGRGPLDAAELFLKTTKDSLSGIQALSQHLGAAVPIKVESATFSTDVNALTGMRVNLDFTARYITVSGEWKSEQMSLDIDFANLGQTSATLLKKLLSIG